jgi:hypothetical protein
MGFQVSKKINDSILEKRWPRNDTDVKDDPYETPTLVYNREMNQLVVANIINSEVEKENILGLNDKEGSEGPETTHLRDTIIDSDEEKEESMTPRSKMDEEMEESTTPRSRMGSNNVNSTTRKIGSIQYFRHRGPRNN